MIIKSIIKTFIREHRVQLTLAALCLLAGSGLFYRQILDPERRKGKEKEFLVVHYTANPWPSGNAEENAYYLKSHRDAGTHWVVDDKEWVQCADEDQSVSAVGGRNWSGFIPKPWLKDRIKNANTINYELCFGWNRDNVHILDTTAKVMAWTLVNRGLEIGAVVRHFDAKGKPCPFFGSVLLTKEQWVEYYNSPNPLLSPYYNKGYEAVCFFKFKRLVRFYQLGHLYRLGKIDWAEYERLTLRDLGPQAAKENKYVFSF